ncbi:ABC-2 transporter permease [Clostridium niameyense]|uniref:ABC-2 transporter permease n=1 Tax=Clostridium niameyense TaxID=1622073 RepID=UPI00067F6EF5|nr:ABC-2 transporter permease [Clostridium niameyense]
MFNLNLLKKEFLQGKSGLKSIWAIVLVLIFLGNKLTTEGLYFYIIFSLVYMFSYTSDAMDNNYKGSYIINSLPVNRHEVVISKYLNRVLMIFIFTILCQPLSYILKGFGYNPLSFKGAISIIVFITFINSINYLVYFSANSKVSQITSMILYPGICGSCFGFLSKSSHLSISYIMNLFNNYLFILLVVIILIISISVSLILYPIRDL